MVDEEAAAVEADAICMAASPEKASRSPMSQETDPEASPHDPKVEATETKLSPSGTAFRNLTPVARPGPRLATLAMTITKSPTLTNVGAEMVTDTSPPPTARVVAPPPLEV